MRRWDDAGAALALALMALIPLLELGLRPILGGGVDNAPAVVQHLGLVMALLGALGAQRNGHLTRLGSALPTDRNDPVWALLGGLSRLSVAFWCGVLAWASAQFVRTELDSGATLAYGLPIGWVQALLPLGFAGLGLQSATGGARGPSGPNDTHSAQSSNGSDAPGNENGTGPSPSRWLWLPAAAATAAGWLAAGQWGESGLPLWPLALWLLALLLTGAPVFVVLGGLALSLFAQDGQPLASVALSHYQITVNPSLPALPLFTLAGLIFARTGAAQRLSVLFVAVFGRGQRGTVLAVAVLCSCFTAFTGGSGVTLLALGGLLLPLLLRAGVPERTGIGLVTSASALGVLLAPSVPLIMYAILARVPIQTMFLAGLLPAVVMVLCLLWVGGFLRLGARPQPQALQAGPAPATESTPVLALGPALWLAKWELFTPAVALACLVGGLATPTETAAITAALAAATQAWAHRDLPAARLGSCLVDGAQIIGGVMLILGMALGLTNYLVDSGLPLDAAEWVQSWIPDRHVFLLVLSAFLLLAGALMEIYAAIVFLVPLLLPMAQSYGIDPVHFGILFLANMEMGFLAPPAGMNLYFASAMFHKPLREVAVAVLPAVAAMALGSLIVAWVPWLSLALPALVSG